ncbi:MAG: T9SS type A sorting domain-containing protein, partial [Muribaculaceae bacterium]|nr:T9SS type A sorting domain-containing protein [Muribaculaceae bacterium]
PVYLNPSAQPGETIFSDECVELRPWEGMTTVTINVAADASFPTRSMYSEPLTGFATKSKAFGDVKISSKKLEDGKTYYLRARGSYTVTTSTANKYTDYTPTYSFTYSAEEGGVNDLTVDKTATWLENASTLHVGAGIDKVTVFDISGSTVAVYEVSDAGETLDLSALPSGAFLVQAGQTTLKLIR